MKTIIFKQLTFVNFKGIKSLTVDFNPEITEIKGDNGTGKTTIMDGILFLLFGKDSADRKDFEIKTLDENNQVIAKLDHEVTGVIDVDGHTVTLKRCFREKWQKRRGSEESEFTGNETLFYVDDVPYQAGQYADKINSIIDELLFKMVTSPHYFNAMKWQDRREVLIQLAGEVKDADVAKTKPEFEKLLSELSGKSFDEFRRSISEKKKRLKDDLAQIPARIDEVNRSLPVEPDYDKLAADLVAANAEIAKVDGLLTDTLKLSEDTLKKEREKQQKIYALQGNLSKMQFDAKEKAHSGHRERESKLNGLRNDLDQAKTKLAGHDTAVKNNELKIEFIEKQIANLRLQWNTENTKQIVFNDHEFVCPTCKRAYEPQDVEEQKAEMVANFNRDKLAKCKKISDQGKEITAQVQQLKASNMALLDEITVLSDKVVAIELMISDITATAIEPTGVNLDADADYQAIKKQIAELEAEQYATPDNIELKSQKEQLQLAISRMNKDLSVKETVARGRERIGELETDMRTKSQMLADLEKQEFVMSDFERIKMNKIESRVNGMFRYVKFKMFNTLINGGSEPTCETLISGVPYSDANHAGKINAGLDIINTLSDYQQVSAPVIIDNAEAINELLPVKSQMIRLVVSRDKTLQIS